jgi:hypothetical protein
MDAILAAAAAEAAARNAADAAARDAAAAAAKAASDAAAAQAAAAKAAADAAAQKAAAVENIVKDAAANNYFSAQSTQIDATQAQYNLDFYNSLAGHPFTYGILNAQQNFLFTQYLDIKYGDVSLSPELEAMEKIAFLMFEDAFTAITKGQWEATVKAEEDAADAKAQTETTTGNTGGGGGGGYSGGGQSGGSGSPSGGGGFGSGWGGGSGGWGREVIYQAEKGINVYIDDEGQTIVEYE